MLSTQAFVILTILLIATTASPVPHRGARLQPRHGSHSYDSVPADPIIPSISNAAPTLTESAVQSSQPQTSPLLSSKASENSISLPGSSAVLSSIATGPSQTITAPATTGDKNTDGSVTVSTSALVFSETQGAITFLDDGKPVGTRTATTFEVTAFGTAGPEATGEDQSQKAAVLSSSSSDVVSASRLVTEPSIPSTVITTTLATNTASGASGKQKGSVPAIGNGPGSKEPNFNTVAPTPTSSVFEAPGQLSTGDSYNRALSTAIPSISPGQIASVGASSGDTATGAAPSQGNGATSTPSTDKFATAASSNVGSTTAALSVQPLPSPSSTSEGAIQLPSQSAQASSTSGGLSATNTLSSSILASQTTTAGLAQFSSFPASVSQISSVLSSATVPAGNPSPQISAITSSAPGEGPALPSSALASAPLSSGTASSFVAASSVVVPSAPGRLPDVTITLPGTGPRLQAGGGGISSSIQAAPTTLASVPTPSVSSSIPTVASPSPTQTLPSPSTFVTVSTRTAEAGSGTGPSSSLTSASLQVSTDLQSPPTLPTATAPSETAPEGQPGTALPSAEGPGITVVPVAPYPSDPNEKTVTVTQTATATVVGSA